LELAVSILRHLNGETGIAPSSARDLESVIGDLEEAEAALRSSVP